LLLTRIITQCDESSIFNLLIDRRQFNDTATQLRSDIHSSVLSVVLTKRNTNEALKFDLYHQLENNLQNYNPTRPETSGTKLRGQNAKTNFTETIQYKINTSTQNSH